MILKGKKAIITGGARGIGQDIAFSFLREGASVYCVDLNPPENPEEYRQIASEHGGSAEFFEVNVANEEQVDAAVKKIMDQSEGNIDTLINNAGITRDNLILRMSDDEWSSVISVNLTSAFYVSRNVVRHMIKRRTGSVINIASIVGVIGNAGQTNYSASKAGLIGLTKSLAREVAARNVRVNAIAPGFINTKMTQKLNEQQKDMLRQNIPLGKIGEPTDIANAALFLASDLASYITGHVLHVTGGLGM